MAGMTRRKLNTDLFGIFDLVKKPVVPPGGTVKAKYCPRELMMNFTCSS
jgi:hypothetical protein